LGDKGHKYLKQQIKALLENTFMELCSLATIDFQVFSIGMVGA